MASLHVEQSIARYNLLNWGENYFSINDAGDLMVRLNDGPHDQAISLHHILQQAQQQGLALPMLLRFKSILRDRVHVLKAAFHQAYRVEQCEAAQYLPVYPIKVNQQHSVVEQICMASLSGCVSNGVSDSAPPAAGLECGSKAELMAVLVVFCQCAKRVPQADLSVICNGYKDRQYLRLALQGEQLGFNVFIVIERLSELDAVLALADEMKVMPRLGLRVRLSTLGKGKWQNSGGEKSKFGLTPVNLLEAVNRLNASNKQGALQLLHFHIGSQVANIHDIHKGLREAAQTYCELVNLGFNLQWLDVGGGLGVDYEGSRSRRFCSMNYSINEYARNIVHTLKSVCHQAGVAFPHIMTEAGRAMTAHHATILSEVFDSESVPVANPQEPAPGSPECLRRMWRSHQDIQSSNALNLVELYHELCEGLAELRSASVHGLIRLEQRAQGETIYHSTLLALSAKLKPSNRSSKEIIDEISNATVDKLFINLSIFRSLPDVWGIDQVFPIVPIEHLDKALTRQVVVQDVTCDSDGRIDQYVDGDDIEASLPVAEENLKPGSLYGFFLAGAYQEILGDNHNLFGEIDTVDVELGPDGSVSFSYPEKGDSIACVLESVHFSEGSLNTVYQDHISGLHVEPDKKQALRDAFSSAVCSSPYLSKN